MARALILLVFPSIDARAANELKNAKVFMGYNSPKSLNLSLYNPKFPFNAALFFTKEDFRTAYNGVERILSTHNTRDQTSQCLGALKVEIEDTAVLWYEAEEYLDQN